MLALLLASLAQAAPAPAAAPPAAWSWPTGTPVLYHVETQILTPRTVKYYAANNLDAKAIAVQGGADTTCTAAPEGKNWLVTCDLTWVRIAARAADAAEQQEIDRIFEEWSRDLTGADVTFVHTRDGKLREFDLHRPEQRTRQEGYVIESQRMVLQRMFAGFDLPLPEKEEDWKRGWTQKGGPAVMQLQVVSGTVGASEIQHTRQADKWGLLTIASSGRGSLSPGGAVDSTGTMIIDVRMSGEALFDAQKGQLVYRDFTLDARRTAASQQTGSNAEFFQASAIQRVDAFTGDGTPPISVAASRAPKIDVPPPAPPEGVAVVPFAELGMQPLFVTGMPEAAKPLDLPTTKVTARVVVGADGKPTSVTATKGYQVLATPTEDALRGAAFPARGAPYAVDVDVEWRPEKG